MSVRLTLKDVAVAAGVSQMTVSRVVRKDPLVSLRTREHVESVIEEIGYVPNKLAGSLAHARSNQIAVVIPSLVNNVFSQVLAGITSELEKAAYNPVVGVSNYDRQKEEDLILSMLSWRPAGVIVTGLSHTHRTRRILKKTPVPVVEIMDIGSAPIDMAVGLNHKLAVETLAEHLISRGYRNFGYLGWQENDYPAATRFVAFRNYLAARGFGLNAPDIFDAPPDLPSGKRGLEHLIRHAQHLDIVVFSNDIAAIGGMQFCLENHISVPGRLAISGFSGLRMGQALACPLTTIHTFRRETGIQAARNVINRLSQTPVKPIVDMGFELIAGASA